MRAGIWARSVCINEGLETGSMLPFANLAEKLGMAVLVMNPNYNSDPETGVAIPHNESSIEHAIFVWKHYVVNSGFEDICVVVHSAGGSCLIAIQRRFEATFYRQVTKIAFTESCVIDKSELTEEQQEFMFRNAVHYKSSNLALCAELSNDPDSDTCPVVSAGHPKHEYSTGYALKAICDQFNMN